MTGPLPPPPGPTTWDEDEDSCANISPWDEAMWWADQGIEKPLIDMLRSDEVLGFHDRHAREFIIGRLTGKIKRPVGKPKSRPRGTFALDFDDSVIWIKESGAKWYNAAAYVRRRKAEQAENGRKIDAHNKIVEMAATKFKVLSEAGLHKWLKTGKKERFERFGINAPPRKRRPRKKQVKP